jgi:hypothetical protein
MPCLVARFLPDECMMTRELGTRQHAETKLRGHSRDVAILNQDMRPTDLAAALQKLEFGHYDSFGVVHT